MTIKEEKALKNYIKGLVRESISETPWDYPMIDSPGLEDPVWWPYRGIIDDVIKIVESALPHVGGGEIRKWVEEILEHWVEDDLMSENPKDNIQGIAEDVISNLEEEERNHDYYHDSDEFPYESRRTRKKLVNEGDDDDRYYGGGLPDHYFDDPDDEPLDYEDDDEDRPDPIADGPEGLWYAHDPAYRDDVDLRHELKAKRSMGGESDDIAGLDELRKLCEGYAREAKEDLFGYEEDPEDFDFDDDEEYDDEHYEPFATQDYGIYELRKMCEGMARSAVKSYLSEGKKKGSKKTTRKKDGKKKGVGSQEKTIMDKLNSDEVNAASYYYKLYGAKTEAEKASARSKGYKKAKGKKNKQSGARYRFTSKERNRLNSMLTDK